MNFYEHTIINKHDLSTKDVQYSKNKYGKINNTEGKESKKEKRQYLSLQKMWQQTRKKQKKRYAGRWEDICHNVQGKGEGLRKERNI